MKTYKAKLRDREWSCNSCNEMHDRDYNAARNILAEGLQIVGISTIKVDIINPELISGNIKDFRIPRLKSWEYVKLEVIQ